MVYRRKRYGRKTPGIPKRAYKKRANRRRTGFKARVKRVVHRLSEKKQVCFPGSLRPLCLSVNGQSLSDNVITLGPSSGTQNALALNQGTGNAARIGNRVTTRRLLFKYQITAASYDSVFNTNPRPTYVKFLFFKSKLEPSSNLLASQIIGSGAAGAKLFESSQTTAGLQGTVLDLNRKISNDSYTYMGSRTFKMGFSSYTGTEASAGAPFIAANQYFFNNDFKLTRYGTIDCTKWYSKTVKFNDAGEVNNPWLFCVVQTIAADGGLFGTDQRPILLNYEQQFVFEDM